MRFMWLNLIAAGLWAAGFIGVGYGAGLLLRPMVERLAHHFTLVMLGIFLVMMGLVFLVHRLQAWIAARHARQQGGEVTNPAE